MALPYCIPYFDAHCDTLTKFNSLRQSSRNHIDLLRLHHYAPAAQVMAIWAPPGFDGPTAFRRIMLTVERELKENRDLAALCTSVAEVDAAAKDDMVAVFLSVEGANLLRCSVAGLLDGYRRGVRMVTLCWNKDNRLCGSAMDTGAGLTADGVRFVNTCWEKGVAVDLSHASEKTFWDVLRRGGLLRCRCLLRFGERFRPRRYLRRRFRSRRRRRFIGVGRQRSRRDCREHRRRKKQRQCFL